MRNQTSSLQQSRSHYPLASHHRWYLTPHCLCHQAV